MHNLPRSLVGGHSFLTSNSTFGSDRFKASSVQCSSRISPSSFTAPSTPAGRTRHQPCPSKVALSHDLGTMNHLYVPHRLSLIPPPSFPRGRPITSWCMQVSCQPSVVAITLRCHHLAHELPPTVAAEFMILHIAVVLHGFGVAPWVGVDDDFTATFTVFGRHSIDRLETRRKLIKTHIRFSNISP